MRKDKLIEFVYLRECREGGFTFCPPLHPSVQETFYAVHILKTLRRKPQNPEKTAEYLRGEIKRRSIFTVYHACKALQLLDEKPEIRELKDFLLSKLEENMQNSFENEVLYKSEGITDVYNFEVPSQVENICYIVELLNEIGGEFDKSKVVNFILNFKRREGIINLGTAYFILKTLKLCSYELNLPNITKYLRARELPQGGFVSFYNAYPPYIEDIFFWLKSAELLKISPRYKNETLQLINKLQNEDGGFRRSIYGGISTLEYSYCAVASIEILSKS